MTGYPRLWRALWALVTAVGVGLAVLEWSPTLTVMSLLLQVAAAWVVTLLVRSCLPTDEIAPGTPPASLATPAVRIGAGAVALEAVVAGSPPLAALMVLLAVVTAPPLLGRLRGSPPRRQTGRVPTPTSLVPSGVEARDRAGELVAATADAAPMERFTDAELSALWSRTFWELKEPRGLRDRLCVVALRQACLDELERRDPDALEAWLHARPRPFGGPDGFGGTGGSGGTHRRTGGTDAG